MTQMHLKDCSFQTFSGGMPPHPPSLGVLRPPQSRHLTLMVSLYTQVYKWVLTNLMLRVTLRWTSIPSRDEILAVASCYRNQDKLRPDGPLGPNADFTLPYLTWPDLTWPELTWPDLTLRPPQCTLHICMLAGVPTMYFIAIRQLLYIAPSFLFSSSHSETFVCQKSTTQSGEWLSSLHSVYDKFKNTRKYSSMLMPLLCTSALKSL